MQLEISEEIGGVCLKVLLVASEDMLDGDAIPYTIGKCSHSVVPYVYGGVNSFRIKVRWKRI
jgi:hypothetical protein